jgi:hypothetical protein
MPRVQQKRGTNANLTSVDPTPLAGELLVVTDENTLVIGNGSDSYTSLSYVTATPRSHTQAWSTITDTPTTLSGYGITDAVSSSDARLTDTRTPTDGSVTTAKIADDAVTYAKMQDVSATDRLLGRSSAGAGVVEEITCTSFGRSLIDDADAAAGRTTLGAAPAASPTFTGDVTIPDKIVHAGDNSAIRFPADDTVTIETAGSERVRVDSAGRVGINTASANASVHIKAPAGQSKGIIVERDSADAAGIDYNTTGGFVGGVYGINGGGVRLFTANGAGGTISEAMRITPVALVGIGTTSPSSLLHVNGVITVSATSGSAGSYAPSLTFSGDANTGFGQVSGQSDTASIFTAGAERLRVRSDGNIGIGGDGGSNVGVYHQYTLSSASTRYGELVMPTVSAASTSTVLLCSVASTLAASATTTTLTSFHTNGSTLGSGASITNQFGLFIGSGFTAATNNYGVYSGIASATGRWNFYAGGTAQNYFNGNVGIGASRLTPATALDINGDVTITDKVIHSGDTDTAIRFPANDAVAVETGGSERLRVKSTGAVRFFPLAADPATGETGDVYYNSVDNKLRVYDGTNWVDLH